jgi:ketosteroid isomerase-like protein
MYALSRKGTSRHQQVPRISVEHRFALILVLLVGISGAFGQKCPAGQPKTENGLLDVEQSWAKALEQHDVSAVNCILANEFEDADVDGQLHNRSDALDRVAHRRPGHNELEGMRGHVYDDVAFVRGLNNVIAADGKRVAQVRFTDIFVYRDGRWQAVAGHETLLTSQSK